jgi:hypothetical protein
VSRSLGGFGVPRPMTKIHIVGFFGDFVVFYFRYIDLESSQSMQWFVHY